MPIHKKILLALLVPLCLLGAHDPHYKPEYLADDLHYNPAHSVAESVIGEPQAAVLQNHAATNGSRMSPPPGFLHKFMHGQHYHQPQQNMASHNQLIRGHEALSTAPFPPATAANLTISPAALTMHAPSGSATPPIQTSPSPMPEQSPTSAASSALQTPHSEQSTSLSSGLAQMRGIFAHFTNNLRSELDQSHAVNKAVADEQRTKEVLRDQALHKMLEQQAKLGNEIRELTAQHAIFGAHLKEQQQTTVKLETSIESVRKDLYALDTRLAKQEKQGKEHAQQMIHFLARLRLVEVERASQPSAKISAQTTTAASSSSAAYASAAAAAASKPNRKKRRKTLRPAKTASVVPSALTS